MNNLGLANIFERKEIEIASKNLIYYECIDVTLGFWSNFKSNKKLLFIVLTVVLEEKIFSISSKY